MYEEGTMRLRGIAVGLLGALSIACGGVDEKDPAESTARPTCEEIASVCHHSETEEGQACHHLGHAEDSTDEECAAQRDACLAACGDTHHH